MSRSTRLPVIKDRSVTTKEYWCHVRRKWKQHLHINKYDEDLAFPSPRHYINDYDYCDWIIDLRYIEDAEKYWSVENYRRK